MSIPWKSALWRLLRTGGAGALSIAGALVAYLLVDPSGLRDMGLPAYLIPVAMALLTAADKYFREKGKEKNNGTDLR